MKRFEGAKSREFDDYNQYGFCQYLAAPHGFQNGYTFFWPHTVAKCQFFYTEKSGYIATITGT